MADNDANRDQLLLGRIQGLEPTADATDGAANEPPVATAAPPPDDATAQLQKLGQRLDQMTTRIDAVARELQKSRGLTASVLEDPRFSTALVGKLADVLGPKVAAIAGEACEPLAAELARDVSRFVHASRRWSWGALLSVIVAFGGGAAVGLGGAYWWGYHDALATHATHHRAAPPHNKHIVSSRTNA